MKSVGLVLKLRSGCYEEYKKRHDELWPEMVSAMTSNGVASIIYRHGELLFVHEQAPSEEAFRKMGDHPVTAGWNRHMAEVLETDSQGQPLYLTLPLAFSFGVFKQSP
jgi:L-rhamnose mutarotase